MKHTEDKNLFTFLTGHRCDTNGDQFIGPCIFCGDEDHFMFNDEFQYDCKKCGAQGNQYVFIREFYNLLTPERNIEELARIKSLPERSLNDLGVRYNHFDRSYIIPTYRSGKINNLYKYVPKTNTIYVATGFDQTVFNYPEYIADEVWICEGHWDRIAAESIIGSRSGITALGVPGANIFKPDWANLLAGRDVLLLYDNDEAGEAGRRRLVEKIIADSPHKPKKIRYINWEGKPNKYDLRDLLIEHKAKAWEYIEDNSCDYETPEGVVIVKSSEEDIAPDFSCDTFDELINRFEKVYHVTTDMKLALCLVLSSIYSIKLDTEQLWVRLIGPPSCGKTTIANAVAASNQVVLRSTFTGLFSGWKDDNEDDPSMIPLIKDRTLLVKDADALLQQPNVARIFSELRDFYDKNCSTQFKNRVQRDYRNVKSTMVLCGTNVLRRSDQAYLGERFVDFEMKISPKDEALINARQLERQISLAMNTGDMPSELSVRAATKGFIEHLMKRSPIRIPTQEEQLRITMFAWLGAKLRSKVDRNRNQEITFTPISELAPRLIGQLTSLFFSSSVVTGDNQSLVSKLKTKIILDILDENSNRFKVCANLVEQDQEQGWTRDEVVEATGIARTTVTRELDDLKALDFLRIEKIDTGVPGRKVHKVNLRPEYHTAFRRLLNGS